MGCMVLKYKDVIVVANYQRKSRDIEEVVNGGEIRECGKVGNGGEVRD